MTKPTILRAHLGTALHAGTAAFDSSRLPGGTPISADDAASVFVDSLHNPEREVDYRGDDITLREAERIGLRLNTAYCFDIAPQFQYIAVEAKLNPLEIDCGNGITVRLTGSMDRARIALNPNGIVIPDVKSGSRVISDGVAVIKARSAQLGVYQLMYEQTEKVETAGAQIIALHTSSKPSAAVSEVFDAKRVLLGSGIEGEPPGLIDIAARLFRAGLFPPNPASWRCSERYCPRFSTCPYHE